MSDFDAFTSSEPPAQEEDPAADFLAREQEELAELGDDNFTGSGFEQQPTDSASADPSTTEPAPAAAEAAADDLSMFESQPQPSSNANDDLGGFGGFDALSDNDMQQQQGMPPTLDIFNSQPSNDDFGFGGSGEGGMATLDSLDQRLDSEESGPQDLYSSVRSVDTERKEPEKIRKWREEQVVRLAQKDKDETKRMEEWREMAKKELDDWHRHRDEQSVKAKALNRESEAEFIKERDESMPGHEWERICRLCEFNPKHTRSQKDISRMRSILLQLKQNPTVQAKVM